MSSGLNTEFLRQARQLRKLSLVEVAAFANISQERLRSFEAAAATPTFAQLERLGEIYNVSALAFYGSRLVQFEDLLPDFRKATPTAANLSPKGLVRIWQVQRQAQFVAELIAGLGRDAPQRSTFRRLTNQAQPASEPLRDHFDAWLSRVKRKVKLGGTPEDTFSGYLRIFIEVHGCGTVFNSAPDKDYLGFFTDHDENNALFVNRDQPYVKRKLFTLSHEMAHFLYDAEGVSNPFDAKNAVEKKCNEYAASFLAPEKSVRKMFEGVSRSKASASEMIDTLSAQSLLSRQASALRLQELNIITKKQSAEFFKFARSKKVLREIETKSASAPMGRGAAVGKKLSEVGVYNAYVAGKALSSGVADVFDIERGLNISENLQKDVFDLASRRFEAGIE